MTHDLTALLITAASVGFIHTVLGPDHYVPFVAMSRTGGWSMRKTALVTFLCGVGHVMSSVVLGMIGIALGLAVAGLQAIESVRGSVAAWALIAFGLVYFAWGVRRAVRNTPHTHTHPHPGGVIHSHEHIHTESHMHVHAEGGVQPRTETEAQRDGPGRSRGRVPAHGSSDTAKMTPWILFTIFVMGPCEPLIPLLMYPAAKGGGFNVVAVAAVFSAVTILTMMTVVALAVRGVAVIPSHSVGRYAHAAAGLAVFLCGVSIQFLGL